MLQVKSQMQNCEFIYVPPCLKHGATMLCDLFITMHVSVLTRFLTLLFNVSQSSVAVKAE